MAFWRSDTLKRRIAAEELVVPFDERRVVHSAYEMGVGAEAFITSSPSDKTILESGTKVVIPPGQFGMLVTKEIVTVPRDAIAFISIRAGIKFQGLINVSGFHVDPGFSGKLKFGVYNAGSRAIVLDQDQRVFVLWFADLDGVDSDPYVSRTRNAVAISADDVSKLQGDVASPATLKKQIDDLRTELDKKFNVAEQTRLLNRTLIVFLLGVGASVLVLLVKTLLDRLP